MAAIRKKSSRDIEKAYPRKLFIAKLRRLADCLEQGKRFRIQIADEKIAVPLDAVITIEHEREGKNQEVEFQLKWRNESR